MVLSKVRFAEYTAASRECTNQLQSAGNVYRAQLSARAADEANALQSPTTAEIAVGDYYDGPPVTIDNVGACAASSDPNTWV